MRRERHAANAKLTQVATRLRDGAPRAETEDILEFFYSGRPYSG